MDHLARSYYRVAGTMKDKLLITQYLLMGIELRLEESSSDTTRGLSTLIEGPYTVVSDDSQSNPYTTIHGVCPKTKTPMKIRIVDSDHENPTFRNPIQTFISGTWKPVREPNLRLLLPDNRHGEVMNEHVS